jgi:hypothetical protein
MALFSDKMIARHMLQARQHGYTLIHFIRINAKRWLRVIVIDAVLILSAYYFLHNYYLLFLIIGLCAGCYARDFAWFRSIQKSWGFTVKITDWQKVEELAKDESKT